MADTGAIPAAPAASVADAPAVANATTTDTTTTDTTTTTTAVAVGEALIDASIDGDLAAATSMLSVRPESAAAADSDGLTALHW
jgi:hypothetical protein